MNDWHGLYGEGWTNEIVSMAFSHPAKFARGLIRRIYEHAIEEGWLAEGDTVVDPFAGVALGGLDAMFHGLNWVGCELEDKFVGLGDQNIALWNSRYWNGMLPRWGTAVILRGDSRNLIDVLDGARAKGIVTSPPYANRRPEASGGGVNLEKQYETYKAQGGGASFEKFCHTQRLHSQGYGNADGQLAAMPEGEIDTVLNNQHSDVKACISSPPYEKSMDSSQKCGIDWLKAGRPDRCYPSPDRISPQVDGGMAYGGAPGQLGQEQGDTFWSAAKVIVSQCYQVLAPGGYAIWVVKDFVRNKQIVPFCEQWREICESCGFETLHEHRCWLVEDGGGQYTLNGDLVEKRVERKSFFRRLYEKKYPENLIDYEVVWCMRKVT